MTFGEMLSALYADLGYPQPSTDQTTRLKRYINEGYRHLLSQPGREKMRDGTITLTTVANQASYAMPMEVAKIYRMIQTTNQQPLLGMTMDEYRMANPGLDQSSSFAYRYVPYGWAPVFRQPGGTGLWAVSTSAADTTQRVNVAGYLSNGDIATPVQSAVLTGTSRVQIGTATTWNILNRLDLTAVGAGVISIYDAAVSGNELIRLQPGQTSAQYWHIILFPTPADAGVNYTVDVQLALVDLVNDNDIPLVDPDFHDMLPLYARRREYMSAGADPRLPMAEAEWRQRGIDLSRKLDWDDSVHIAMGAGSGYGFNNLGGWFPADFYIGSGYRG